MYECFFEIAFEAELNTKEDPELLELAEEICNEYQGTRDRDITELRKMVFDRQECFPYRMDDAFLLRFLRSRNFVVPRAHKLLVRHCAFREEHKHLFEGVDLWDLAKVKNAYEGALTDHPDVGRLSIFRYGMWDPNEFPVEDLVRAGVAMVEIGLRQPKLQVLGGTAIVDLEGLTVKHIAALTPTIAYQIVCLLGLATPTRMNSCHVINYSWLLNSFFYIFKKFIPQRAWDSIHFHGNDLKSLHKHIDLKHLPPRYGGTSRSTVSYSVWLTKLKKYRDKEFDKDMKQLGYIIKE